MDPITLLAAFDDLKALWSPKVVARVNDQFVKIAKVKGAIAWHAHENEDELFLVLKGQLRIEFESDEAVILNAGDMHVVPKGVRHNPVAQEECWIVLIETATTKHTGDVVTPQTKSIESQLATFRP